MSSEALTVRERNWLGDQGQAQIERKFDALLAALAVAREREQRATEAVRLGHVYLDDALDSTGQTDDELIEEQGVFYTRLVCARDVLRAALVDEPAAATLAEPGAGHDLCACGATLIVCHKCGDSRCLACDPYDERDTCGAAVPGRYQGGTDGEDSASAAADEPGERPCPACGATDWLADYQGPDQRRVDHCAECGWPPPMPMSPEEYRALPARGTPLEACDCGSAQEDHGWACRCSDPPSKRAASAAADEPGERPCPARESLFPDGELARVDAAIAAFDRVNGSVDDFVLLLLRRADLAGIPLTIEQVASFLCISEDDALDIFARLSERGFIEEAPSGSPSGKGRGG